VSTTRLELRRRIARRLGDLRVFVATADGDAGGTTFTDADNVVGENYAGREVRFTGGTSANLGAVRYVNSSDRTSGTLTFSRALPAQTQEGDECEAMNFRGTGWRFDEVHDAINAALGNAGPAAGPTVAVPLTDAFDAETGTLVVPAELAFVHGVEWQDAYDYWHPVGRAGVRGTDGYRLLRGQGLVELYGGSRTAADGYAVRLVGRTAPLPLEDDADETDVDAGWLVAAACYELVWAALTRSGGQGTVERERALAQFDAEATRLRSKVVGRLAPNSEAVW
jgi:hypothetical protein